MTYQPTEITAFLSSDGTIFASKDDAIRANFMEDVVEKATEHGLLVTDLMKFIAANPDMTRVLLGDREAR